MYNRQPIDLSRGETCPLAARQIASRAAEIFPEKDLNQSPRNWFNLPERFE